MKTFFIGLNDKLLIIEEKEAGYMARTHLHEMRSNRLAFDPKNEKRIYAATSGGGLWRTEDKGETWVKIGVPKLTEAAVKKSGISSTRVTAVAVHPRRLVNGNHVVYAGTEPSMLYYSEDLGDTWQEFVGIQKLPSKENWRFPPRPDTHFVRWITPSYWDKDHLALSIEAGAILHTTDHGQTWQDRPDKSPIDTHTLLAHPHEPGRLYAANGDGASKLERSYAESLDGGRSWTFISAGLENQPYLYNMALNSENPNERLVSASKNATYAHRSPRFSTIFRKMNNDKWQELASGLPRAEAYTHHLAEDPTQAGAFYALNNFGIYYLAVGDDTWRKLPIDAAEFDFAQRPYCFVVKEYKS